MNKSLVLAYNSFHAMVTTTITTLPYILVGVLVFGLFYFLSKGVRSLITKLTSARSGHHSLAWSLIASPKAPCLCSACWLAS